MRLRIQAQQYHYADRNQRKPPVSAAMTRTVSQAARFRLLENREDVPEKVLTSGRRLP
ncbi:hypothetical protein [Streptomyces sp. NPDC091217]|uniref:hypothetical protein n=1 Tax=Streptomyces sp. NPDC091217 TaxID=3365975 RepID=UPI00380BF542